MRILTLTLFSVLIIGTAVGQSADLDRFFAKYENQTGFESYHIDAEMLQNHYSQCRAEAETLQTEREVQLTELIDQFQSVSVLIWDGEEAGKSDRLYNEAQRIIQRDGGLEELLSVSGAEISIQGLIREKYEGIISDLVGVVNEENNFVLVLVKGELDISKAFRYVGLMSQFPEMMSSEDNGSQVRMPAGNITSVEVWPNPSGSLFNIQYHLAERSEVRWSVYDATGRALSTSANQEFPGGIQTMSWKAPAKGFYTLVIEADGLRNSYNLIATD